jgi:hypothetical protein
MKKFFLFPRRSKMESKSGSARVQLLNNVTVLKCKEEEDASLCHISLIVFVDVLSSVLVVVVTY